MADLRDYTKKNTVFVGTDGIRLPKGNNAQRVASANVAGTMRFNTDIDGIETYTSAGWRPLAAPPAINTVSPSTFNGESGTEFTINGDGFTPDAQVYFVTSNSTAILAATVSYYSAVQLRATTPRVIKVEEEPLSVRVVQQSGTTTKINCIDAGGVPSWVTTGGALGSIFGANTVNVYVTATDPEGTAISYQLASGSLPSGLSLSANGLIQGLASSVLANTLYNFVIKANDTVNNNTDRSFSYTVLNRAPVINTASGSLGTIYSGNAVPTATISAYDPDGGQIVFSAPTGNIVNTTIGSANGTIIGTPIVVTTNTTYSIGITVTDEGSLTASNTYTYTVLNRPPLWNTAATLTAINGADPYTPITVNAYDPDGGSVTYSLTSGSVPSGLTFVSANATITGTPTEVTDNITSTFTVTVTDPGSDSNARTFSLTVTPVIDNQFANTVLLLHGNANTVIKDASSNNRSLTVFGDVRPSNFSPFNTSWSANFGDGEGNLYWADSSAFTLGSGDFAIEFWWWPTSFSAEQDLFGQWSSGDSNESWLMYSGGSVTGFSYVTDGATDKYVNSSTRPTIGRWNHICACRNNNTISYYINGVRTATVSESAAISDSSRPWCAGGRGGSSYGRIKGLISDFRIVKGTNPYNATSASLTVPTAPLTDIAGTSFHVFHRANGFVDSITGALPTFVDTVSMVGSNPFANNETDTSTGSMYFDGSGDYLSLGTPYNFGTNNFTVEGWYYFTSIASTQGLWGASNGGGGGVPKLQPYLASGNFGLDFNGTSIIHVTAANYIPINSWVHIAFCRGGTGTNQLAAFVNGVRVGLGTMGNQTSISTNFTIGYSEYGVIGSSYISNFRIVDGTDVYGYTNSTITVPTSPLTAIPNTRVLTLQNRQPFNNHGFKDSSQSKSLVTRYGNASQGTFTPFSADPGKWSNYFNGSSGVRFADNAAFQFGTNAFTVEGWFLVNSTPSNDASVISKWVAANDGNSSWMVDFQSSNLSAAISIGGSVTRITASVGVPLGVWNHFALVRSGSPGTLSLFMNGSRIATGTPTGSLVDDSNPVGLGVRGGTDGYYLTGFLTNIRIVNGTALYDPTLTTYTVPTSVLTAVTNTKLLTCQDKQFIDNSTANSGAGFTATALSTPFVQPFSPFAPNTAYSTANTGGSLYLDGSGDYLLTQPSHPFNNPLNAFRTNSFCIEAWHYGTTTSGGGHIVSSRNAGVNDAATITAYVTGGNYSFYGNGNHVSAAYVTGQWNHVVYTRDASSTLRLFINGKLANYEDSFTPDITARQFGIGSLTNGGEIIPACWISDIRLVSGYIPTDYQTSSKTNGTQIFTPPTAPLTINSQGAQSNSVCLLMNFTDAAIIDSTGRNVIETVTEAKVNTAASKFAESSIYFNASSGTRLQIPASNPLFGMGTANHTIEFWMNPLSSSSQGCMFDFRSSDTSGQGIAILYSTSRTVFVYMQGNRITSTALTNGTWYHIAVVRASNVYTLYLDGVSQGTWANSDSVAPPANRPYVGAVSDNSQVFDGLIQDVRVTRSARYTTNFTPPTRLFPNR
jgi:hypothetical protein